MDPVKVADGTAATVAAYKRDLFGQHRVPLTTFDRFTGALRPGSAARPNRLAAGKMGEEQALR